MRVAARVAALVACLAAGGDGTMTGQALPAAPAPGRVWHVAPGGDGDGSPTAPLGTIQSAIDRAQPGDTVLVASGSYPEALRSVRDGQPGRPIVVRAPTSRSAIVESAESPLLVAHAHHQFEGLVFDGRFAPVDAVRVGTAAANLVLRDVEVRRSGRDCVDIAGASDVLVEGATIHHCLWWDGERRDAHGVVAGAVRRLTLRDTEVHTFSGDALQVDPGRREPGWDEVRVEGCRLWLKPLEEATNGFPAGQTPGENAIDTKAAVGAPRARLTVAHTLAEGFTGAIGNQAAFNLKENIQVLIDGVTVRNSDVAFRVRGPGKSGGAEVEIRNAVVELVRVGARYEDDIARFRLWNSTFGRQVPIILKGASSRRTVPDVRNTAVLGKRLPRGLSGRGNLALGPDAFVNAAGGDYRLARGSRAIDAGVPLPEVATDREGRSRPSGRGWDVGAYEFEQR